MPKNLFGEETHTAVIGSYPVIEDAPVFSVPLKGFRAIYDAPETGYASWKVLCATCEKQWGEFELIDAEWLKKYEAPTRESLHTVTAARLISLGFKLFTNGTVMCPGCNGQATTLKPLSDWYPPTPVSWFSGELG